MYLNIGSVVFDLSNTNYVELCRIMSNITVPRVRIELTTFRWLTFHSSVFYIYAIMRLTRCLLRYRGAWIPAGVSANATIKDRM